MRRIVTGTANSDNVGPVDKWGSVLTELIPLALVVALSPLSIIPAVLVLHTPRPRPTGLAFLVGWLVGLAGVDGHLPRGVQPGSAGSVTSRRAGRRGCGSSSARR